MSAGGIGQGAVYSPLPQSVIDSDTSEEELHSNSVTNRKPVVSFNKYNGEKMSDYRQLDYDREADTSMNGIGTMHQHQSTRDDVRIIKPDDDIAIRRRTPMGPVRTFFFAISIFLCFFTVIVFLWILPCDWAVCPELSHKPGVKQWDRILNRLELKGSISVVPGLDGRGRNLVMMGRCKIVNDTSDSEAHGTECINSLTEGGLISLVGSTGEVAWWKPLRGLPREMDCSLIDVDINGVDDCIVVGAKGLLVAIDPISGILIWNMNSINDSLRNVIELEFPFILPDLDKDGVNELITSYTGSSSIANYTGSSGIANSMIIISGKTGTVMGQPFRIPDCIKVHGLNLDENLNVSYVCQDKSGRESSKLITIRDLFYSMTLNQSIPTLSFKSLSSRLKQHRSLIRAKHVNGPVKTYSYDINGRRLILENRGRCPLHCSVTVKVLDKRQGFSNEVVWNYTGDNMYAMVPATLLFNNRTLANGTVLTEPISGFVLKFWQWNYVLREDMKAESATSSNNPVFRNRLRKNMRYYRSILPTLKHTPDASIHQLKERVILITFNATDMHIVNASQNEVVQLCILDNSDEIVCQPDLEFQEQSLLIADLDQDSSQELVSYYTTYVNVKSGPNDTQGSWRLESKVRAIRLEAELPKLYEAVSQQ